MICLNCGRDDENVGILFYEHNGQTVCDKCYLILRCNENPPVTYTYTTRGMSSMPTPSDEELREAEQKLSKMFSDGFDEYYRLEAQGYRLMRPDEMIDSGDEKPDDE